ncbi:uncharacterized protein LOC125676365 [Ostrea edulis]|uniref:uncharacterized protein LOC125676365 n=1 Tax=Ostrea edulis TaxID=37623 RepID=UPI0024AF8809|nr:uncharacterized protein LOC125676365 [Ostrea edulis]
MASQGEHTSRKLRNNKNVSPSELNTSGTDRQMSAIQDSLKTITGKLDDISQLQKSIDNINKDLWDEDGVDERIKYMGQQFEDNTSELESLRKENFCLRRELQVLKSVVINLDRRLTQQENEVVDLRGRSMRDNILIHNLSEEEDEDLSHKVRGLIKEHLQIDVNFVRIHRNGQKNSGSTRPRTITGKLQNSSNKDRILSAIRQKREISGLSDMPFYITPQTPLQMNENKKKLQEMNNKYREENVKTKIVGNKLVFPNGNIYRDRVLPPRAEDILMMDDQEVDKLEGITVINGDKFSQEGNIFTSLSSTADTYAEVRNMYKKVLRDPDFACANHNILAYRFKDAEGKIHDGYCDNGEYGAGRRMLKTLADQGFLNVAVIVSRKLGKHLGPLRFDIMNKLALSAAAKL